jgi:cytoskeletal protein RodZ
LLQQVDVVTEISRRLRAARERAELSLEDISATTKIRVAALQAIERGQFERLPGEFYARAFLKAYARELHLPPDEIVEAYDASRPGALPQTPAVEAGSQRDRTPRQFSLPTRWRPLLSMTLNGPVAVTIAVVLLVVMLVRNRPVADRPHEAGAVGTSGAAAAPVAAPATPQPEGAPDKLVLEIQPSGPIWVTGAASG